MKKIWERYGAKTVAIVLLIAIVFGVIAVISIFAGSIMTFLGFEYDSVWSIIWFFLIAAIISYPISLIANVLPRVLLHEFKKITLLQAKMMYIFLDTIATAMGLTLVDYFMQSVSATDVAILVFSFVLAVVSVKEVEESMISNKR